MRELFVLNELCLSRCRVAVEAVGFYPTCLSGLRHGWCCLTAHQLACLEKLVLRYSFFNGYRKNECQCVLSFQYPMSLLGLDGTLSPERRQGLIFEDLSERNQRDQDRTSIKYARIDEHWQ